MFVLTGILRCLPLILMCLSSFRAVMAHCWQRGAEVVVGDQSHLYLWGQGGMAQVRLLSCPLILQVMHFFYHAVKGYCFCFLLALEQFLEGSIKTSLQPKLILLWNLISLVGAACCGLYWFCFALGLPRLLQNKSIRWQKN